MKNKILSVVLCMLLSLSLIPFTIYAENDTLAMSNSFNDYSVLRYTDYLIDSNNEYSGKDILICDESLKLEKNSFVEFDFNIIDSGLYQVYFEYLSNNDSSNSMSAALFVDEKQPFSECNNIVLNRLWENSAEFKHNEYGNDNRPTVIEKKEWQSYYFSDSDGYYQEPFAIFFNSGEHKIKMQNNSDSFYIRKVKLLGKVEENMSYSQYLKKYSEANRYNGDSITFQAENFSTVSSRSLVASNDMSDCATYPCDYRYIKLNTLGGTNWKYFGNTASWNVNVDEEGLYKIAFRFRQNYYNGLSTHRKLYVNGKVPFSEANDISFDYGVKWQISDNDFYIYLNKGENVISLECVLGSNREILSDLEKIIYNLNKLYRKIITTTGTSPDIYRDYNLEKEIPDLINDLKVYSSQISDLIKIVEKNYAGGGSEISTLNQVYYQVNDMIKDPDSITRNSRLSRFKSNISSLGTWANKLREQPLEIDCIYLYGNPSDLPDSGAGFLKTVSYKFKRFIFSFVNDYRTVGESFDTNSDSIRVWVSTGRDQAQLLKNMVEDSFTPDYGTNVSVELVAGGLIEAILAGNGPDVALDRAETDPVNFAMRNALYEISKFSDFEDVSKEFISESFTPYTYKGEVYALPITQTYEMMFYRKDIFEELNLDVPKTWDELILYVLPVLQSQNMTVGIGQLTDCNIYKTLLYQSGGKVYSDDLMTSALDSQIAYDTFKTAVNLYTDYDLPQSYDFMNRFRTGEMPLGIASYTVYNNLKLGAPELNGMWEMVCIPGVDNGNGEINNTQIMTSTAAVITKNSKNLKGSWDFLKWYLCTETQGRYGNDIEAILGAAGRYNPANKNAISQLPWDTEQLEKLEKQRQNVSTLPNLPGSYFTQRAIHNAFVSSVIDSKNPRESLLYWNEEINYELERKRVEFNYSPEQ